METPIASARNWRKAIRWLEQSVTDAGPDNPYIRVHPFLDPLRGDPRFEALAEKVVPAREVRVLRMKISFDSTHSRLRLHVSKGDQTRVRIPRFPTLEVSDQR